MDNPTDEELDREGDDYERQRERDEERDKQRSKGRDAMSRRVTGAEAQTQPNSERVPSGCCMKRRSAEPPRNDYTRKPSARTPTYPWGPESTSQETGTVALSHLKPGEEAMTPRHITRRATGCTYQENDGDYLQLTS